MLQFNTKISSNEILAAILSQNGDKQIRNGVTKGWYYARMRDALEGLGINNFYLQDLTCDIPNWNEDAPDKGRGKNYIKVPQSILDIDELYLYEGEEFKVESSTIVHWKKDMNNMNAASGVYTAQRKQDGVLDPVFGLQTDSSIVSSTATTLTSNICFANEQNGYLMITTGFEAYPHLRIKYTGIPSGNIRDEDIVPIQFRKYIEVFVLEEYYTKKLGEDHTKYSYVHDTIHRKLHGDRYNVGLKTEAHRMCVKLSKWKKRGMNEYIGRPNY